ncbi:MAG TPA: sulfatase-like hydrolase/transferase [Candidatus Akkermansia intestinigallinarum]|uniref:Sulfatase-like hydrolase/transferase n=1 Tax=Candidatus Akkermansia intestinigallinarum TaxID=2838431 RepID=A0A9D1VAE2_9BACT|nr:sulfatase-like hydrolase/transferase [Candidatus Akkermansia intestinigallinarum]
MFRLFFSVIFAVLSLLPLHADSTAEQHPAQPDRPRAIVIFLADDLGLHDTSTYGCAEVPCPNLDRLAGEGLLFTDAHSTTSVCTPSRFSLLTGKYAWRQRGTGVLDGDAKLILPTKQEALTLPAAMQLAGYRTAAIGKWHLGLGRGNQPTNWNAPIAPGPREVGFDYSFIMAATADRVPCVFLRNGTVVGLDPKDPIEVSYEPGFRFDEERTAETHPELLKPWGRPRNAQHACTIIDGISRIGHMRGGSAALWRDQDLADRITDEAVNFIRESAGRPIFLYFCTNDIHVPRDPHRRFRGKSGLGIRGDVTLQMDDSLGRIRRALEEAGYADDCLFIFTSDNGPVINDGYLDGSHEACANHNPAAPHAGGKYGILEGGTRVPFVVCWPGRVAPGRSAALVSQVDLARSLAVLAGVEVPEGSMPDSEVQLDALMGRDAQGRGCLVEHQAMNNRLALRVGALKYVEPWRRQPARLYDLSRDPREERDLAPAAPAEQLQRFESLLREIRESVRPQ